MYWFGDQECRFRLSIYKARELNPEFPKNIDLSCWEIGLAEYKSDNLDCKECIIVSDCKMTL
ncbi:hypothetical protein NE686_14970 [Tissierella carlieri]|uniref:Uncharacterized protein n=2 Tax=Tissierella carlieri TaxID=689904 RepID=A0ABT1SD36_9FIRM|nr:hypothetical protein [Tissierella carlieri]